MDIAQWVKLMRQAKPVSVSFIAESGTLKPVVPYNQDRIVLYLGGVDNNAIYWSPDGNDTVRRGLCGDIVGHGQLLSIVLHGALVHGPWWAVSLAGDVACSYTEIVLRLP